MAEQVQKQHAGTEQRTEDVDATPGPKTEDVERREALNAETDALLDDIDELLDELELNTETAAYDFVAGYQQKGGE